MLFFLSFFEFPKNVLTINNVNNILLSKLFQSILLDNFVDGRKYMFIGREQELKAVNELYKKNGFQLFVLYGRRRVGKTTFLNEFCKGKPAIFYSAEQTNDRMNLDKFSELILGHYGEKNIDNFTTWEKAFRYIYERQNGEKLIIVIDEFPYLANVNKGLMSVLQHLIDHYLKDSNIFMVLCGSYMGFMEKEVLGAKSPLFGRRTMQLHMKPFDYYTTSKFLTNYTAEEKILFYGIYGGTPLYLRQIDTTTSLEENVKKTYLNKMGYLYEEPILLLRQEVQEPGVYYAIAEAIAGGAVRANEISGKTGEEVSKCIKYIGTLVELGIVSKETPFGVKDRSRKTQYQINDNMFRFWYRYVSANRTLLETEAYNIVWKKRIDVDLPNYMGHIFEHVCMEFLLRKNSRGELPILFTEIGRWWGNDSKKREEVEIDIVAGEERNYLIGECKWRNEKTDLQILKRLEEKADVFSRHREKTWYVIFSKSGFTKTLEEEAKGREDVILFHVEDLFIC